MRSRGISLVVAVTLVAAGGAAIGAARSGKDVAHAQVPEAYSLSGIWPSNAGPRPIGYVREPGGLTAAADGTVYLADVARGMIHVWRGDQFVAVFGGQGSAAGQLDHPHGLCMLGNDVLAADTGNGRVQRFTADGRFVAAWNGLGEPWGVSTTGDGLVLVTDRLGDRIYVLDQDGRRVGTLGGSGSAWGRLAGPLGIDAWPDGHFAVVDSGNHRVQVMALDGSPMTVITDTSDLPLLDVSALADGDVLVAGLRQVIRYRLSPAVVAVGVSGAPVPGGFSGVAVVPDATTALSPTMYAALNHDYLTGLRRFTGGALYPHEEWLSLPGPAGELASPRRLSVGSDAMLLLDAWPRLQRWSTDGLPLDQVPLAVASDAEPAGTDAIVANSETVRRLRGTAEVWGWRPVSGTVWVGGIAYDATADRTFAVDLLGQVIHALDGAGAEVAAWRIDTPDAGGAYQAITDVAPLPGGRLLLVNRTRARLEVRGITDGALLTAWPVRGVPLRAAPDAAGNVFVLTREGWVWKLDDTGAVRSWWSVPDEAPDGASATDIAVAPDGRVLVLDGSGSRVLVFDRDLDASPPVAPPDSGCTFVRDKRAAPSRIPLGDSVTVTLGLSGLCADQGAETDVMLVMDRSGSMQGAKMEAARTAAVSFMGEMDFTVARVGLAVFNTEATLAISLTANADQLLAAVAHIEPPNGGTDIGEGIQVAAAELEDHGRPGVRKVMVVMSDGRPEGFSVDADAAAFAAKSAGIRIFSIGFGPDVDPELMRRIATAPSDYFFAPSSAELAGIYTEIARRITGGVVARDMVVTDTVPANMVYQVGSAVPPVALFDGRVLRWEVASVTRDWSASYRLQPQEAGTWPTNVDARSRFRDGLGNDALLIFPVPQVLVYVPAEPLYLPMATKNQCWQRTRHADVALVIDTSSSMTGEKLAAAKAAARAFVLLLDLPLDQAAVISFNKTATMASQLSGDQARLLAAIDGLGIVPGTVIDAGLRLAVGELTSLRTRPDNSRVLVLLTDGVNNAGPAPVLAAAASARNAGIVIFTVALGADADRSLMLQVAGDRGRAYLALDAADLERIYSEIAGRVGCEP